ncbi:MAG: B12-binding domain-containing radical SAM protein [Deltaproteobacteria bacterium]|nr:B12-binding domain-containing radical SAM protein [Deltaproteobacteria bacterium]
MRVLLVRPPAVHSVEHEVPEAVKAEATAYPPLGLLHLATWIRDRGRHEVAVLDAQAEGLDAPAVADRVRRYAPDVVGISAFTVYLVDLVAVVEAVRACPSVRWVVLGGPHVNDFPLEARALPGVDAVVRGEGQVPLTALLEAWSAGGDGRGIPGVLVHPDDPEPALVTTTDDLDELPVPDRTLVDSRRYYDVLGNGAPFSTVVTSRGCPYRCTFCNTPRHRFRSMSASRTCDEIQACLDLGITDIYFVDDTFNITNRRVHEMCDEVLARGQRFTWTVRMRVNGVDRPLLEKMKAAGCTRIQYGVEQGTEEGLQRLQKDVTLEEIRTAFRLSRKVGIRTVAYFLLGTPTERTRRDVLRTILFSIRLDPDFALYNILTPFPGTRLYDEGVEEGVIRDDAWRAFLRSPTPEFRAQTWDRHFSADDLERFHRLAYRVFYGRPRFLARNLLQIRSAADLERKARAGLRLLLER